MTERYRYNQGVFGAFTVLMAELTADNTGAVRINNLPVIRNKLMSHKLLVASN